MTLASRLTHRANAVAVAALVLLLPATLWADAPPPPASWEDLLARTDTGVEAWHRANPSHDGRGVVLAILDTGVDPGVAGLDRDPDGNLRLVAVRDFSRQGRIALKRAERHEADDTFRTDEGSVRGWPGSARGVNARGVDGLWLGFFDEERIGNPSARDLDRDGRTDGRFAVALWTDPDSGEPRVAIDLNGDGDLSDERAFSSYERDPHIFQFASKDPRRNHSPLNFSIFIDAAAHAVELHFDDGGHGTHCAGIAAGKGIAGIVGFDGVAPGARLMSLKIGDNRLAGGATTDGAMIEAVRYASRWAREHRRPVVMNLSYGIASQSEGGSRIEALIDAELKANPLLLASVSAGNDGPGLSTIGTPAGADLVWTAGALLPSEQAETLFGARGEGGKGKGLPPQPFAFSSRGGELAKPDGLTPGVAWSTVPPFFRRNVMAGTSMAAPHAAGLMALLVGRAEAEGLPWSPALIARAMRMSGAPVKGMSRLDQGAGVVQVEAAWRHLQRISRDLPASPDRWLAGYAVATPVPHRPGEVGTSSFWRLGGRPDRGRESVAFSVSPIFHDDADDASKETWMVPHTLTSDARWARPDRGRVIMRGPNAAQINVQVDFDAIHREPGLHVATIRAETSRGLAFALPIAVIVPHFLDPSGLLEARGSLSPGQIARVFVEAPAGLGALEASLTVRGKGQGEALLMPFSPEGVGEDTWAHRAHTTEKPTIRKSWSPDAMTPGLWELVIHAPFRNPAAISWTLGVESRLVQAKARLSYRVDSARAVSASWTLINRSELPLRGGELEAAIDGFATETTLALKGGEATRPIVVGPGLDHVALSLAMQPDAYDAFTDIAVSVLDPNGRTIVKDGLSGPRLLLAIPGRAGTYTLKIEGARAERQDERPLSLELEERHILAKPHAVNVTPPEGMDAGITLYPGVATPLGLSLPGPLSELPAGYHHVGFARLIDRDGVRWVDLRLTLHPYDP